MSGRKSWNEIGTKSQGDAKRRARIEQGEQAIEVGLTISELRDDFHATQEYATENMHVALSNIFLRSLASYVEALGGRLEIRAVFPDQVMKLAVPSVQKEQSGPSQHEQEVGF